MLPTPVLDMTGLSIHWLKTCREGSSEQAQCTQWQVRIHSCPAHQAAGPTLTSASVVSLLSLPTKMRGPWAAGGSTRSLPAWLPMLLRASAATMLAGGSAASASYRSWSALHHTSSDAAASTPWTPEPAESPAESRSVSHFRCMILAAQRQDDTRQEQAPAQLLLMW